MIQRDPWKGILDEDEKILWQGRPDCKFKLSLGQFVGGLFGLTFAGFALFWMISVFMAAGGFFWMFGLLHFIVGAVMAGFSLVGPAYKCRHTWYTLTDRRAFIATDMIFKGKFLNFYPITSETHLTFQDGNPASVYFHNGFRTTKKNSQNIGIGFERIQDGATVYRHMRDIQKRHPA